MQEVLYREFVYLWYYFVIQFRQIFKYWILGMAIGSVVSVLAKKKIHGEKFWQKHQGDGSIFSCGNPAVSYISKVCAS